MKRKRKVPKVEFPFFVNKGSQARFSPAWISSELTGVNPEAFAKAFDTMTDAWDEILRYLKFHPDRSSSNDTADRVRKEMKFGNFSGPDFRRLYHLALGHFQDFPQKFPCDPHLVRRIVGIDVGSPCISDIGFSYNRIKIIGKWNPPDELWDLNIQPTTYGAIEEVKDEQGNLTYTLYVQCFEVDIETYEELARWLIGMLRKTKELRQTKEMVAFVPSAREETL